MAGMNDGDDDDVHVRAAQLQAAGNAFYSDGRYEDARAQYTQALALIEATAGAVSTDARQRTAHSAAQLLSNRAQTYIQERDFAAALHGMMMSFDVYRNCTQALKRDPENEKATLRRLVALENLERFEVALQHVDAVLDRKGARESTPALFQYAVAARRRLRKNLVKDKEVAASEVKQMGKMVHENQQLRINFGCLLPSKVPLGEYVEVIANIGNEFGLFRRDYLKPGERMYLQCSLRNNTDKKYKLIFHAASSDDALDQSDASTYSVRDDGRLTLNDRGKVVFRMAIVESACEGAAAATSTETRTNMSLMISVHGDSSATWNLFPVVSLPFDLVTSSEALMDGSIGDLGVHCCRPIEMVGIDQEILLAESPGNLGIGGKLWDSCLVLTRYLSQHKAFVANKSVVELGSGLGLVGIFCAMLGAARVTLTDIDDVVPLLQYNIDLNFPSSSSSEPSHECVPLAVAHFWGTSTSDLPEPHPDVLVLSDVVYDPEGYVPLVTSLDALATPATVILMAHRSRNPMEHQFFELLATKFSSERIDWASGMETPLTTATTSQGVLQDVKIFRLQRL
ncbi:putative n2,n2-dimethylguanosine trna methyltransferase, partial [Globisporangium splendens]